MDQPEPITHSASDTRGGRLLSLDAFRGLTVLGMVLVNNPGKWGDKFQYDVLEHANWHGWTPTDLIFPFFLFIVGTALAYALRNYRDGARIQSSGYWRIVRRTALLIFLGWFPSLFFRSLAWLSGAREAIDLETLRLTGVLVRIGVVYFCVSMLVLHVKLRGQVAIAIAILLGYWALLAWLPTGADYQQNLSRDGNVVGLVDRAVLGLDHMYSGGGNTDPEGLLSTLPAVVTSLLGYWTGLFLQRGGVNYRSAAILAGWGLLSAAIGQGWHRWFPINKQLWTSSFVLLAGGLAMVMLAICLVMFDLWDWRRLARPFAIVGVNAILVFVGSGLLATTFARWIVADSTLQERIFTGYLSAATSAAAVTGAAWIGDPRFASLCFALSVVAFWWLVCWVLARLNWQLRV